MLRAREAEPASNRPKDPYHRDRPMTHALSRSLRTWSRGAWLAGFVGLAVLAPPMSALADERPTYALNWSRGEGARDCATGAVLAKQVETKLGRPVFVSPSSAELSIE